MTKCGVLVECAQLRLKGLIEDFVWVLPEEDEELGPLDVPQNGSPSFVVMAER